MNVIKHPLQTKFTKSYGPDEEEKRKQIYFENKIKVEEHNKKFEQGEVTWSMGINHFSDLTEEEFKKRHTGGLCPPK